ncbi:hypothetical protein FZW96_00230 [Bacillus sp. BGMRC 2118]|nr:hypothetical protein FZW96_00230 [Bacillus sp. BGMRC 2118]
MKKGFVLIVSVAFLLIVGCTNQPNIISEETMIIEEQIDTEGQYNVIKEITDKAEIETVVEIFKNARWEEAWDKSTFPDYVMNNRYDLWIRSNNTLKVRIYSKDAILSKKDSKRLYEMMTDEKLGE